MSITCSAIVTSKVTSATSSIQIGSFTWPSAAPIPGSVLKTDGSGNLVFEASNVRSTVDPLSTAYIIDSSDDIVAITGTLNTTLTLPNPASKSVGDMIEVVKEVDGSSTVTVVPFASEHISGASSAVLSQPYGSVKMYTNGTDWFALY